MRDLESIRASKVWIPEGDKVGQIVFQALGITPIALPISDVFTGLQTGLIETVAVNPTSAIAFQWHSSTSYMTETPISYIIGVLAVQKKAFDKLSTAEQAVVRDEIAKVFSRLDVLNRSDNLAAKAALKQQGIIFVTPDPEEVERWKSISDGAIDEMVASGIISAEIVSQVREYLQSFRSSQ
jgi:TRAP-type C4-dicarboxylate transport system substrate-binding protein